MPNNYKNLIIMICMLRQTLHFRIHLNYYKSYSAINIQPFTVVLAIAGVNHSQKMVLPHGRQKTEG